MNWYTVADIAKATRIPAPTARRYAALFKDFLPSRKVGRVTRYSEEAVRIFEHISRLYGEGLVTPEIEESLQREYSRVIDVPRGSNAPALARTDAVPTEITQAMAELMDKFSACFEILADQKRIIETQREDIQKLKTAFVLLARSQKKLKELAPPGLDAFRTSVDAKTHALTRKNAEIEELALGLSFDASDLKIKMQILEQELVRLRKDRREMEKYLQEKIERLRPK